MAILTKKAILEAEDFRKELVKVPEWGGEVYICSMTGAARDDWEASIGGGGKGAKPNLVNFRARLVALTAVDEKGDRLFCDDDLVALGGKSAAALNRCFETAQKLNALTSEDVEELSGN